MTGAESTGSERRYRVGITSVSRRCVRTYAATGGGRRGPGVGNATAAARTIRRGTAGDAPAAAAILNAWIDARDWMPRVHTPEEVAAFYDDFVFRNREVWVTGMPVDGFMALDPVEGIVTALYVAQPGRGIGKALLDHAKAGRDRLELWTFLANEGARRFYVREGFREVRRTAGETNEEGLPDVLLRWVRP